MTPEDKSAIESEAHERDLAAAEEKCQWRQELWARVTRYKGLI